MECGIATPGVTEAATASIAEEPAPSRASENVFASSNRKVKTGSMGPIADVQHWTHTHCGLRSERVIHPGQRGQLMPVLRSTLR